MLFFVFQYRRESYKGTRPLFIDSKCIPCALTATLVPALYSNKALLHPNLHKNKASISELHHHKQKITSKNKYIMPEKCHLMTNTQSEKKEDTGSHTAVCNVAGNRCDSDCRSGGREFDPGPVPYLRGYLS